MPGWSLVLFCLWNLAGPLPFEAIFTGRTLRLDTVHTGHASLELVSLDRWRLLGPWAGSWRRLVDSRNMGLYRLEMRAAASGRLLYARGYATIFGEYATTGPALKGIRQSFSESLTMPEPRQKVRVLLKKRDRSGHWQNLWSSNYSRQDPQVDRTPVHTAGRLFILKLRGASRSKVDLLLAGDGYTAEQQGLFLAACHKLLAALFAAEPFKSRREDFNLRALLLPSNQAGISDPRGGHWVDTALHCRFNIFGLDRYLLTLENQRLQRQVAGVPHDQLIILGNTAKYGGGGIYHLYSTCAARNPAAPFVFVHELGHAFAGLADEYYSSSVAYRDLGDAQVEPWEPNITRLLDPGKLKWKDLVTPRTPLPTPWDQAGLERLKKLHARRLLKLRREGASLEKLEALRKKNAAELMHFFESQKFWGHVGAFEGAGYAPRGFYRPTLLSIMSARLSRSFNSPSRRAILEAIDLESR